MRTFAKAGALIIVAALAGCAFDSDGIDGTATTEERDQVELLVASGDFNLPMCGWIEESLRGQMGTFFKLRTADNFVAMSWQGQVVCVDEPSIVLRAGVIPVTNEQEPACSFCEGTPLPAEIVVEWARRTSAQRTDL